MLISAAARAFSLAAVKFSSCWRIVVSTGDSSPRASSRGSRGRGSFSGQFASSRRHFNFSIDPILGLSCHARWTDRVSKYNGLSFCGLLLSYQQIRYLLTSRRFTAQLPSVERVNTLLCLKPIDSPSFFRSESKDTTGKLACSL
jgi:hypothetical protein